MPEDIWPEVRRINLKKPEHELFRLAQELALKYEVHISEIKSKSQKHFLKGVRIEFICRAVKAGHTREAIGDYLNRHHSTITGIYQDHKHRYEEEEKTT